MQKNRAARHSCNYHRAKASTRTKSILTYEQTLNISALIIGVAFGVMFFLGLM